MLIVAMKSLPVVIAMIGWFFAILIKKRQRLIKAYYFLTFIDGGDCSPNDANKKVAKLYPSGALDMWTVEDLNDANQYSAQHFEAENNKLIQTAISRGFEDKDNAKT